MGKAPCRDIQVGMFPLVWVSGSVVCLLFTFCFLAKPVLATSLGDTFLTSDQEGLVAMANYYKKVTSSPGGKEKVRSSHLEWADSVWCHDKMTHQASRNQRIPVKIQAPLGLAGFQKFHWVWIIYFSFALEKLKTGFILIHRHRKKTIFLMLLLA